MATKFMEPGGDSTFDDFLWLTTGGGAVATDFVHGGHIKSFSYSTGSVSTLQIGDVLGTSGKESLWIYLNALPSATVQFARLQTVGLGGVVTLCLTSGGVLQLRNNNQGGTQLGSNGTTLSTGVWYQIVLAHTISSTTVNEFRVFVNNALSITATNVTITNTAVSNWIIGNVNGNATLDLRTSDHYVNDSADLADPGAIWVTAKRPIANGTINGFTTQVGAGGSGYGTGHSPQVNERPRSTTNGWRIIGAGSAVTEEYNIETKSQGDIDISTATIVDYAGWGQIQGLISEGGNIILNGNSTAITIDGNPIQVARGSATYPAGTGADVGFQTDTTLTTTTLYECGIMVAYIPFVASSASTKNLTLLGVG